MKTNIHVVTTTPIKTGNTWRASTMAALLVAASTTFPAPVFNSQAAAHRTRPNVVLIITDDQGHGDLGFHGNPKIRTPHLDQLARESVRFVNFYVMPVCSPTRACLLTGRYNYRTGVVDTYLGRSLMEPGEVTLPEMLGRAGYRTGIFGKWHLGDTYPMRPIDQGFQEALVLKGGGIGQPSDPPSGESYFDPILQHNGKPLKTQGYVSDVITDAAIEFIRRNRENPFFVYLAFNAPHTPLEVPDEYLGKYRGLDLSHSEFPNRGHALPGKADQAMIAKVYGMVENIDDNMGRLTAKLDEWGLSRNTVVIFMTDNGPQQVRYNSGMFQRKGSVHEGGIRVPFFVRWPAQFEAGRAVDRIAAHIDIAPTLLDLCRARKPARVKFDGKSLLPLLRGSAVNWPDRTLYFQWHRGDTPQLYRAFAARSQRHKLVQPGGVPEGTWTNPPAFKLYDLANDPLEFRDIAPENPEIVESMKKGYERWFKDVTRRRDYTVPPRISIGSPRENPTILTRQDWRGPQAGWRADSLGYWEVQVAASGLYSISLQFGALKNPATAHLKIGDVRVEHLLQAGAAECQFSSVQLKRGPNRLEAWLTEGHTNLGVRFVEVRRLREF
ncbi:MAG: arylsulfatase [Verrucomicrobia bacterium]|nr:arylsulfatase [Verrucomicrobiota bacterium]